MFVTAVNTNGYTMHLNTDHIVEVYETSHDGESVANVYLINGKVETFKGSEAKKFVEARCQE